MKKQIIGITVLSLFAAAIVAVSPSARAGDANTKAVAPGQTTAPKHQKHTVIPFHGKLTAVDTDAMTLTIGKRTLQVTSDTKISKAGKPATLSEGTVGEPVRGTYKKAANGELDAMTVYFGAKNAK